MTSSEAQQQTKARIAAIRRLIHDQPALAVRVIRQWLASDGANTTANKTASQASATGPRPERPPSTKLRP